MEALLADRLPAVPDVLRARGRIARRPSDGGDERGGGGVVHRELLGLGLVEATLGTVVTGSHEDRLALCRRLFVQRLFDLVVGTGHPRVLLTRAPGIADDLGQPAGGGA